MKKKELFSNAVFYAFFIGLIGIVLFAVVFGAFRISDKVSDLADETQKYIEVYTDHREAMDSTKAGIITDKEIVNGHYSGGSGLAVNPATGQYGVLVGGNREYVPTQYRLYISFEYMVDGETFEDEKYFDVPADTYNEYDIGDYFDSQNF